MFTSKEKVLSDLDLVKDIQPQPVIDLIKSQIGVDSSEKKDLAPALKGAFVRLYQDILVPSTFIEQCGIDDPLGEKVALLNGQMTFTQTAKQKHMQTNQRDGIRKSEMHSLLGFRDSLNHVVEKNPSDWTDDRDTWVMRDDVEAIVKIDALMLSLYVRNAIQRTFVPLTNAECEVLRYPSMLKVSPEAPEGESELQQQFTRIRSLYLDLPWKTQILNDALEMFDLSESDSDTISAMKDFLSEFMKAISVRRG